MNTVEKRILTDSRFIAAASHLAGPVLHRAMAFLALFLLIALLPRSVQAQTAFESSILGVLLEHEAEIRKDPILGANVIGPLLDQIKDLPWKHDNERFGPYLEYIDDNGHALTIFNAGNYAGSARVVFAFSYNGTLIGLEDRDGVWGALPGLEIENPILFIRVPDISLVNATTVLSAREDYDLPGVLQERVPLAAQVTTELRIPMGALLLAKVGNQGAANTIFDVLNLPDANDSDSYIMVGAGVDQYPPGYDVVGVQETDPALSAWREAKADPMENLAMPTDWLPADPTAYLKISIDGRWNNPLHMFEQKAYAEDPVIAFSSTGPGKLDFSSWGVIRDFYDNDYVYNVDVPDIFPPTKDIPTFTIGLSVDELTLADALKAKLGLMLQLTSVDMLTKWSRLAEGANSGNIDAAAQAMFGQPLDDLNELRSKIDDALDTLPLSEIKIINPKFEDYDPITQSFPNEETFSIYMATGEGKMVLNGDLVLFGETMSSIEGVLVFGEGYHLKKVNQVDIHLGTVMGQSFDIMGKDSLAITLNRTTASFQRHLDVNIVDVLKKELLVEFFTEVTANGITLPQMRLMMDNMANCAPPIPFKIDVTVQMPTTYDELLATITDNFDAVELGSPGDLINCAGQVFRAFVGGAELLGEGTVIGGEFVAANASEVPGAAVEVGLFVADQAPAAGAYLTGYGNNVNNQIGATVGSVIVGPAVQLANTLENFGKDLGCATGWWGNCSEKQKTYPGRVPSPFYTAPGFHYSLEYGRPWWTGATMLAFTGTKTDEQLCLSAEARSISSAGLELAPCDGTLKQQFKIDPSGGLSFQRKMDSTPASVTSESIQKGVRLLVDETGSSGDDLRLDADGRLYTQQGGETFCVRPDDDRTRANQFSLLDKWRRTAGGARDVAVFDGTVYKITEAGWFSTFVESNNTWHAPFANDFVRIDVGAGLFLWAINESAEVLHNVGGGWTVTPGITAIDIGVGGPNGQTVIAIDEGHETYRWNATTSAWEWFLGRGRRVDVDGAGTIWLTQKGGAVWRLADGATGWEALPTLPAGSGGADDIAASRSGGVMVTTHSRDLYAWTGNSWVRFEGSGENITLDARGNPWIVAGFGAQRGAYAFHASDQVSGWNGEPQAGPFDAVSLNGVSLAYDRCEEYSAMDTWTRYEPEVQVDHAANAGLKESFFIQSDFSAVYGNEPQGIPWPVNIQTIRAPELHSGMEFSAIFTGENTFALYNHLSGACLHRGWAPRWRDDLGSELYKAILQTCDFTLDQQWTLVEDPDRDRPYVSINSVGSPGHLIWPGNSRGGIEYASADPQQAPLLFQIPPAGIPTDPHNPSQQFFLQEFEGGQVINREGEGELAWEQQYNALAKDIGVGAYGTVWIVGMDGVVLTFGPAGWETKYSMGSVVRISVHPDGNAWVVQDQGGIHRWDPASGWVGIYGALAHDVAIGADGSRWIVSDTDQVLRFDDSVGWEDMHSGLPGPAKRIAVGPNGSPWVVMEDGAIFVLR